jgi:Kef-type K+ transport system membrane component KefB
MKCTTSRAAVDLNEIFTICCSRSALSLVPIFFVFMGLKVDFRLFTRLDILGLAIALTLAAIIGKQFCALGVVERGVNRLTVGLGMIPRGEVGLIFAGIGASLMLPSATGVSTPVISSAIFGAVVIMVIITTVDYANCTEVVVGQTHEQTGGMNMATTKGPAQGGYSPKTARTTDWFRR